MIQALQIANERRPDLAIDGEFQLDAAVNPEVAAKKVRRESRVAGRANVIIWPDLNVGNVGVKLVQQFAHADAYGPMLQGFKKIVCDCSPAGAPVSEIVGNIAISAVRVCESKKCSKELAHCRGEVMVGLFRGVETVFQTAVEHQAEDLKQFVNIKDQLSSRRDMILRQYK